MTRNFILAIDFDGTIVEHKFPDIGNFLPFAKTALQILVEEGFNIIIWTCRDGIYLDEAKQLLKDNNIFVEAYNENIGNLNFQTSRKIYADMYIDDRNIGGFPGWKNIITYLLPHRLQELLES